MTGQSLPGLAAKYKRCAVLILDSEEYPIASGVLAEVRTKRWCVITNKHVLSISRPVRLSLNFVAGARHCEAQILTWHRELDLVAITPVAPLPDIPLAAVVQRDEFSKGPEIKEGHRVFYWGYPLGLGQEEYDFPVLRRGVIAQVILNRDTFLLDGFASQGSSGSAVYSEHTGKFLGLISGYVQDFLSVSVDRQLEEATIGANSGLGEVIRASGVEEMLEAYVWKDFRERLAQASIRRKPIRKH
ncbi:serine protease [candidate division TA06 bacterium]|uniref:Serine protease n=1 Tax=candidate division TA06 bacterium TaxID=2250710 RepID=A0A523UPC9_UNCT6|nr:MAG: serine protease [candidate division TA06 bacterium]